MATGSGCFFALRKFFNSFFANLLKIIVMTMTQREFSSVPNMFFYSKYVIIKYITMKRGRIKIKSVVKSYMLFLIGLFVASMGVALSTKAGLGTSPVAAIPYSVSLVNHALTFGWWLNMLSVVQIAVQVILLRSKCKPVEIIIQTALAFVYGYLTDFSCELIRGIQADSYVVQFALMALSCFVLGLGIWIQFKGGVAMLPGEAMNRAISEITGKRYENIKILFDVLYIAVAATICFVFLGRLDGVREGSIIAAVVVGNIIKLYNFLFNKLAVRNGKNAGDVDLELESSPANEA